MSRSTPRRASTLVKTAVPTKTSAVKKGVVKKPRVKPAVKRAVKKRRTAVKRVKLTTQRVRSSDATPVVVAVAAHPTIVPSATASVTAWLSPVLVQADTVPHQSSPAAGFKTLPQVQSRSKLWLAVTASSVLIVIVWLYFLKQSWSGVPNAVSNSVANANVQELVNNIQGQLSELKSSASALSAQENTIITQGADQSATAQTQPTTTNPEDLNNLFSDLQ